MPPAMNLPLPPAIDRVIRCIAAETYPYGMTVKDVCRHAKVGTIVADDALRILRTAGMIDRPLAHSGSKKTGYMLTKSGRSWVASHLPDVAGV
jgi:hypothetical protein